MPEPEQTADLPPRPERSSPAPVPAIPTIDGGHLDDPSTVYSRYRTELSGRRTGLSEHRTDLSEFRTDLSQHRTELSDHRTEMSMRRTGMSFQRTRMSADRTLMSEIRTSLSLIGFGFTIYQAFDKMHEAGLIHSAAAPRNFGVVLITLGILLLVGGILRQVQFSVELRAIRTSMMKDGLVHAETRFPISLTLVVAVALLALGLAAILAIAFDLSFLR